MRLTSDVILQAQVCINPLRERELSLRGYKAPAIENLGVTKDGFDCIDFCDNEIKKLENFPRFRRLRMLLMHTNHISKIQPHLEESIGNLQVLVLTNNKIISLSEIDSLAGFRKLDTLVLLGNPVVKRKFYREYVIHKLPGLHVLDYTKIRPAVSPSSLKKLWIDSGDRSGMLQRDYSAQRSEKRTRKKCETMQVVHRHPEYEPVILILIDPLMVRFKLEESTVLATNDSKRLDLVDPQAETTTTTTTVSVTQVQTTERTESMVVEQADGSCSESQDVTMEKVVTSVSVTQTSEESEPIQCTPTKRARHTKSKSDTNVEMMEASPEIVYTPSKPIEMMTVPILRKELKKLNLPTTGLKAELVQRLRQVVDRQN